MTKPGSNLYKKAQIPVSDITWAGLQRYARKHNISVNEAAQQVIRLALKVINDRGGMVMDELAFRELDAWHDLCDSLRDVGVVTQADCDSPVGMRETPGQRVFTAVREWGEVLVQEPPNPDKEAVLRSNLIQQIKQAGLPMPNEGDSIEHRWIEVIKALMEWCKTLARLRSSQR